MSRLLTASEATEFGELLQDYSLGDGGLEQFKASNFAIIAGPAGAGKDTLRNGLTAQYPEQYVPIISTTTRPARDGELDGVTYHYSEVESVQTGLKEREYFQAELVHNQQVSCLHLDEIRKLSAGQTGLSILITKTEQKLSLIKPDIKTVFLIPPDLNTLIDRIHGERMFDDAEVGRRLEAAREEIEYASFADHYYCLVTDSIENVLHKAHTFVQDGQIDSDANAQARHSMKEILFVLTDW